MRKSLDTYDVLPEAMRRYLSQNGFHFNKAAFDKAMRMMKRVNPSTGKVERINPIPKEDVEAFLSANGIELENDIMYDAAYVYNLEYTRSWGSALEDDRHLARRVKDVLDDPNGSDEQPFRNWLQMQVAMGHPVDWEELL